MGQNVSKVDGHWTKTIKRPSESIRMSYFFGNDSIGNCQMEASKSEKAGKHGGIREMLVEKAQSWDHREINLACIEQSCNIIAYENSGDKFAVFYIEPYALQSKYTAVERRRNV